MRCATGAVLCAAWILAVLLRIDAAPGSLAPPQLVDFAAQVQPILSAYCLECHSQDKRKGGLSLATYEDVLDGGRSGAIVRPGNGAGSLMFHRLSGEIEPQMPLDELPLADAEIAVLRLWIDQGARPHPAAPPAPPPWEAPLALERPAVPDVVWAGWSRPVDRLVAAYLARHGRPEAVLVDDARFARRAYLDIWGLLPSRAELETFVADPSPDKRDRLVASLLDDGERYAGHWMSFWNDLLRNEDGVTYFSEEAGRRSITDWLHGALTRNLPYDEFVTRLINPREPGDPDGFVIGVNWRGETSAAVTPWMQASQNTAQVFLGVNLKCNACHDSFVNRWKLKDAYGLAAYFSPEPRLQLFRCDVARDEYAEPGFLYPELSRVPASDSLADRRAAAAAIFTDPRNGRMPRTIVNRIWQRLLGHGIVPDSDEMDGRPWSPEVLDWLASDFVEHDYDVRHLIATIVSSRAYQMRAVAREAEPPARDYVFDGPEIRRLTAEQFADAIGTLTGEWRVYFPPMRSAGGKRGPTDSDPVSAGVYAREWRAASTDLTRALGRPMRDQVTSVRATDATTLQALELANGDTLTRWLARGARRLLGDLPPGPAGLFTVAVAGRYAAARPFDVDVSAASRLWLVVTDTGSNAPERVQPVWADAVFVTAGGASVPLTSLAPIGAIGVRREGLADVSAGTLRVEHPSRLVYDVSGRGFTRFRGTADIENPRSEVGSTLNPQVRFFVFAAEPNMERLMPPAPGMPLMPPPVPATARQVVDHLFWGALGRPPTGTERELAEAALGGPGRPSPEPVADLLWVLLMKPEFQLIH
jgi:hypothetical protein